MKNQLFRYVLVLFIFLLLLPPGNILAYNAPMPVTTDPDQGAFTPNTDPDNTDRPVFSVNAPDQLQVAESSGKKADVVFVIDTTGSMGPYINNVKTNIAAFSQFLVDQGIALRIGVVEYKDIEYDGLDSTVVHKVSNSPWHTIDQFRDTLDLINIDGGGPIEETPLDALGFLLDDLTMLWSTDAYRFAVVLTDAPFRIDNRHGFTSLNEVAGELASRRINTSVITSPAIYGQYSALTNRTNGILGDIDSSEFALVLQELADNIMGVTEKPKKAIYVLPGYMGSNLYNHLNQIIWVDDHVGISNRMLMEITGVTDYLKSTEFGQNRKIIVNPGLDHYGPRDSYKVLVEKLKKEFDQSNGGKYDVIFFPYNWLGDLNDSAKNLEEHINSRGYNRVTFVAHSTGGLLAATYIARSRENKLKVDKAILIGAPLYGTYAALEPIELGMTRHSREQIEMATFLIDMKLLIVGGVTKKQLYRWVQEVTKNSPTTYQLLPSLEYLIHKPFIDTALFEKPYPIMNLNDYYEMLNRSSNINRRLTNNPGSGRFIGNDHYYFRHNVLKSITCVLQEVNTTLIGSQASGWLTPASPVYGNKYFGLGSYGIKDFRYSGYGDGTVMGFSAAAIDHHGRNKLFYKDFPFTSHGQLVTKAEVLTYICNVIKDPIMIGPEPPDAIALEVPFAGMSESIKLNVSADVEVDLNIFDGALTSVASLIDGFPVGFDAEGFAYTPLTVEDDETEFIIYMPNSGYTVVFSAPGRDNDPIDFEVRVATLDADGYITSSANYVAHETGIDGEIIGLDMLSQTVEHETVGSLAEGPDVDTQVYYSAWEIDDDIVLPNVGDTAIVNLSGDDVATGSLAASDLVWASSDSSIVTVSGEGVLEAKDYGVAYVSAAAADGSYRIRSCRVTVPLTATSVSFDDINMVVDEKILINPLFSPAKTTKTHITYSYETAESPVAINEFGVITALKPGNVEVTGTAQGGANNTFNIIISDNVVIAVQGVSVEPSDLTIGLNEEYTLTAVISPADASNQNIIWHVEDDSRLSIIMTDENSCILRGEEVGETIVTAVTIDGGYVARANVKVIDSPDHTPDPGIDPEPDPDPDPVPDPDPAPEHEKSLKLGDINGSGDISVADVTLVTQHILGLKTLTSEQEKLADVNGDQKIDIKDVLLIMKKVLNLIDEFPALP